MKKIILVIILILSSLSYANTSIANNQLEQTNIAIVKQMFAEFAEKRDINKLDTYYTHNFVLESNGKIYSYQQYKRLEQNIFETLKSLKVTSYDDIFAAADKVVARMSIKLMHKDGKIHNFQVILIALMKNNHIEKIWEITYPSWSDKLSAGKKR